MFEGEPIEEKAMLEALRPDPTFYPSPRIAMEAPAKRLAYTVLDQARTGEERSTP